MYKKTGMNKESLVERGDVMQYSEKTVALAKAVALQMLSEADESERQVSFGPSPENASFWIARDKAKIVSPTEIVVNGVSFFFGLFKKEQE